MRIFNSLCVVIIVFLTGSLISTPINAQIDRKEAKKAIKKRAAKAARKEAKKLKKQGFYVSPGSLPMAKLLEEAWIKQYQKDDQGYERFIVAEGSARGQNKIAAKNQALAFAKLTLAGLIQSRVASITKQNIANVQDAEPTSIAKAVTASKTFIAHKLGRVIMLFDVYKDEGRSYESIVRIAYEASMALDIGKQEIRKQLEKETDLLHEELDKLLDMDDGEGEEGGDN